MKQARLLSISHPNPPISMKIQSIAVQNFSSARAKHVELDGVKYLSVPMVMILEGVHNGSNGPIFYSKEELKKIPKMWNMKPVVVHHPKTGDTATTPEIIQNQGVGMVMNARWQDNKLKAEAWINKQKADKVDKRIINAITNGNPMEVSTGMFADFTPQAGKWNNEAYIGTAKQIRADHLAILPEGKGACSVADGAGLLMNEEAISYEEIGRLVRPLLPKDSYLQATFPDFVVYTTFDDARFYKVGYKIEENKATLVGVPEEVRLKTQWETLDGIVIGNAENAPVRCRCYSHIANADQPNNPTQGKDNAMKKEEMIAAMIANAETPWEEKDRETLTAMPDEVIEKVFGTKPVANAESGKTGDDDKDKDKEKEKDKDKKPVENAAATNPPATPLVTDEMICAAIMNGNSPASQVFRDALASHNRERDHLTGMIIANARNTYTKEELTAMNVENLRKLAAFAQPSPGEMVHNAGIPQQNPPMNYAGAGMGAVPIQNTAGGGEALGLPSTRQPS